MKRAVLALSAVLAAVPLACKSNLSISHSAGQLSITAPTDPGAVSGSGAQFLVDFGDLPIGGLDSLALQIASAGAPLQILKVTATSTDPALALPLSANTPLDTNGISVTATFDPTTLGPHQAIYQLSTDSTATPTVTVTLRGVGVSFGLTVAPNPVDFGPVEVNAIGTVQLTVTNTSDAGIPLVASALTGPQAGSFRLDPLTANLGPDQAATFAAHFTPLVASASRSTAAFTLGSCPDCPAVTVSLGGQAVDAALYLAPDPMNFGFVQPNTTATQVLRVRNISASMVNLVAVPSFDQGGVTPGPFGLDGGPSFANLPVAIAAGGELDLPVMFSPTFVGQFGGASLSLQSDEALGPTTLTVPLAGYGGGGLLSCAPPSVAFGAVLVGESGAPQQVVCANTGTTVPGHPEADLSISVALFDDAGAFSLDAGAAGGDGGTTLQAGQQLLLGLGFFAADAGIYQASLVISSNDPNQTSALAVSGQGVVPQTCHSALLPADGLSFGAVPKGQASQLQVALANLGGDYCQVTAAALTSWTAPAFTLIDPPSFPVLLSFPGNLQNPQGLRTELPITVQFAPTGLGVADGGVTFGVDDPQSAHPSVGLTGLGANGCLSLTPNPIEFGTVGFNPGTAKACVPAARRLLVSNSCPTPVTLGSPTISSGVAPVAQFTLVSGPDAGTVVSGGASVSYQLLFSPSGPGPELGSVDLLESDLGSTPRRVTLTGNAQVTGHRTDTFTFAQQKVDILIVLDTDDDADTEIGISSLFPQLLDRAAQLNLDYQLGVTEPCYFPGGSVGQLEPCPTCFNLANSPILITPRSLPDPATALASLVAPFLSDGGNSNCSQDPNSFGQYSDDSFMAATLAALTPPESTGYNSGFLRPDAYLAVFGVNGDIEDDRSWEMTEPQYAQAFHSLKSDPSLESYSYVGEGELVSPEVQTKKFVFDTGGLVFDTLAAGWQSQFLGLLDKQVPPSKVTLGAVPVPSSIQVTVNGVVYPPNDPSQPTFTPEWSYDAASNSVLFKSGYVPAQGSTITVSYDLSC